MTDAVFGEASSGTWELYLDGTSIGLSSTTEDISGAFVDSTGAAYLNTLGNFSTPGLSGGRADIFSTDDDEDLFYDGQANGIGNLLVDGIFLDLGLEIPS